MSSFERLINFRFVTNPSAQHGSEFDARGMPTGTVTFLLTDVEASTPAWENDAMKMDSDLRRLDEKLRSFVTNNGGVVIKSRGEGDSAFAVFDRASAAVVAAYQLQVELLTGDSLAVRAAIHTGEARLRDGDYFSIAPARTARLRSLAHGGQIVISRISAELAEPELPKGLFLAQLGMFRVRDWPRAVEVFGVRGPGLPDDSRPLRVLGDADQALMTLSVIDFPGSTALVAGLTDPEVVKIFREFAKTVRDTFQNCSGTFLKMLGDGCLAAFENPKGALQFSTVLLRATRGRIRVGLHAGLVELIGDDVVGRAIYDASNLVRRAEAGEILATRIVVDLLTLQGASFKKKEVSEEDMDVYLFTSGSADRP